MQVDNSKGKKGGKTDLWWQMIPTQTVEVLKGYQELHLCGHDLTDFLKYALYLLTVQTIQFF